MATAAVAPVVLAATPALAKLDDGEVKGKSLGAGLVILYYVVIPVAIFLVIAFFSVLPSMLRRPRYRPGRAWNHDPMWFAGPDDPDQALVMHTVPEGSPSEAALQLLAGTKTVRASSTAP